MSLCTFTIQAKGNGNKIGQQKKMKMKIKKYTHVTILIQIFGAFIFSCVCVFSTHFFFFCSQFKYTAALSISHVDVFWYSWGAWYWVSVLPTAWIQIDTHSFFIWRDKSVGFCTFAIAIDLDCVLWYGMAYMCVCVCGFSILFILPAGSIIWLDIIVTAAVDLQALSSFHVHIIK